LSHPALADLIAGIDTGLRMVSASTGF